MGTFRDRFAGRHLMIDGETFGTGGNCVFVQLAAAEFWPTEPERQGRVWATHIDLANSLRGGRHIDADTLLWWMDDANGAGMEARAALVAGLKSRDRPPLTWREALEELAQFAQAPAGRGLGHRPEGVNGVWSHGAAFDIARVETAYRDLRMEEPWDFRDQCDTRSLFRLAGSTLRKLAPETGVKHDAGADVQQQVAAVHQAFHIIEGGE
jgi:hypothetical protein